MKRIPSGIPGVDELIEGGFLEGSSTLISGGAGCGKSIFCTQFLYSGAKDYGEPGIFITLEEGPTNIWWNMQRFHWDITKLQTEKKLKIYRFGMYDPAVFANKIDDELKKIQEMVEEMGAKRLVIDSTTAFGLWLEKEQMIRHTIFKISEKLKKLGCTTLLTAETNGKKDVYSAFGVEEFAVDGIVMLYFVPPNRSIFVRKMRGTNHDKRVHPFDITDKGITVHSKDEIMWESLH